MKLYAFLLMKLPAFLLMKLYAFLLIKLAPRLVGHFFPDVRIYYSSSSQSSFQNLSSASLREPNQSS